MPIDLGSLRPITQDTTSTGQGGRPSVPLAPSESVSQMVQEVVRPNGEISLNLAKGLSLDLSKHSPGLKRALIGLGWDANGVASLDLDVFAFCLHNGRVVDGQDVVYFKQKNTGKGVSLSGDNRTGEGDGDDECIYVDFDNIPLDVSSIAIFVNIYDANNANFGMVKNAYVRLVNQDTNKEELIYLLNEEGALYQAFHFANLVRNDNGWSFETVGQGTNGDINQILQRYF